MATDIPTIAYNTGAYIAAAEYAIAAIDEQYINDINKKLRGFTPSELADRPPFGAARYEMIVREFMKNLSLMYTCEIISEAAYDDPVSFLNDPWPRICAYLEKELADTMPAFIAREMESRGDL